MYEKKFYNPNTQFDPEYRNVQKELWQYLTDEQKAIVGGTFKHLKNHTQIEVAEALIDVLAVNLYPDPRDWSDSFSETVFTYITQRLFYSNH